MARWKISRQTFGNEEFTFLEGDEVTVGRAVDNTVSLSSIVVSRNHCVINVQREKVLITDLKSSNGIYVGLKKIPQNTPYVLEDSDLIGFGWTEGAPVANIRDSEKYMFKLVKLKHAVSLTSRLKFQSDNESDDIEEQVAAIADPSRPKQAPSPVLDIKPQLKRKIDVEEVIKKESPENLKNKRVIDNKIEIINLLSDSDNETHLEVSTGKKLKLEPICAELHEQKKKEEIENERKVIKEEPIKTEKEYFEYDAFNVKQEYLGYDDEAIQIDSDSDSESENWLLRLSQSSPGKPFTKIVRDDRIDLKLDESSYSQLDDRIIPEDEGSILLNNGEDNDEGEEEDLIRIPSQPPEQQTNVSLKENTDSREDKTPQTNEEPGDVIEEEFLDDMISITTPFISPSPAQTSNRVEQGNKDVVDGINSNYLSKEFEKGSSTVLETLIEKNKKTQIIEALFQSPKRKLSSANESKHKTSSIKHSKGKKHSSKKHNITNSQKEERKKKLKEIASKEKDCGLNSNKDKSNSTKQDKAVVIAKVTNLNRGAFLSDAIQGVVKPMKRKESPSKSTSAIEKNSEMYPKEASEPQVLDIGDIENKKKQKEKSKREGHKSSKHKNTQDCINSKSTHIKSHKSSETRVPLKSLKPLSESEDYFSGKPFSKVEPFSPKKVKKKVSFSEEAPIVHLFEIEDGNQMKNTSMLKNRALDMFVQQRAPVFSLEKITLIKILRWNPQWLKEQMNTNDPPPILGHNNPPMTIFHSFNSHKQYVQVIGDLLLMEIWEDLTQTYTRLNTQKSNEIQLRIESLPPVPTQERSFELFNFSVNVSVLNSEIKSVPRVGEVMLVTFGPENARTLRFFYVSNIRSLPSPPKNIYSFYSISLQACYTDRMKILRLGEVMLGRRLSYIHNELKLFEAMDYVARSPLSEVIFRPEPKHFAKSDPHPEFKNSNWTHHLNPSQLLAVTTSVSAALSDRPYSIQMVQGPPGTGKSSVICAMVMSYFYDSHNRRQHNRGKILICATSNAAVDELVIRLLTIRQTLPKAERFRMVRVGRVESMHPRARDVSSQQIAKRDADRAQAVPSRPGVSEEISHLEAKVNMWKTQAQDARDPVRVAYCQGRVAQLASRITLLRNGGGGGGRGEELRPDQLAHAERSIIEGAHIVVTTLSSAHSSKMRGLKRRIALCIVDEAGQAIEPQILIPLTLDVTRITLIGDPQQLPGFISSQRAKKHGLGESLFARLTSCAESWPNCHPVVLLNQQYRMHADIADYPNRAFYDGRIQTVRPGRPDLAIPPYTLVGISSGDKGQASSGGNEMEAWGVARLVVALNSMVRALDLSLAVISPYHAHKELIKRNLRVLQDPAEPPVEVTTVDSFQGQERDVIVVSLARSQGVGFLTDPGRMNVMLTRARHALLVCLNPHAMLVNINLGAEYSTKKNQQWRTLVEDAQRRKLYRVLPNKMCQATTPAQLAGDDILKYISSSRSL